MSKLIFAVMLVVSSVLALPVLAQEAPQMKQYDASGFIIECPDPGYTDIHPTVPPCSYNLLVREIDGRMHKLVVELQRQVSGRVTAISDLDKARLDKDYLWLLNAVTLGTAKMMDFHFATKYDLVPYEIHKQKTENSTVNTAVTYIMAANANLRISQSTRLNDGIMPDDVEDLVDAINKSKEFIDSEYANFSPLDMPHSTPSADVIMPTTAN